MRVDSKDMAWRLLKVARLCPPLMDIATEGLKIKFFTQYVCSLSLVDTRY